MRRHVIFCQKISEGSLGKTAVQALEKQTLEGFIVFAKITRACKMSFNRCDVDVWSQWADVQNANQKCMLTSYMLCDRFSTFQSPSRASWTRCSLHTVRYSLTCSYQRVVVSVDFDGLASDGEVFLYFEFRKCFRKAHSMHKKSG